MGSLGEKELLLDAQQRSSGLWSRAVRAAFAFPSVMWGARSAEARGETAVLLRAKRNGHARATLMMSGPAGSVVDAPLTAPLGEEARPAPERHRRGWLVRRLLTAADMMGLSVAFILSSVLFADENPVGDHLSTGTETLIFIATLPLWVAFAKVLGLYEHDDGRADHSTADEAFGVVSLVTFGTWVVFIGGWATKAAQPELDRLISFWLLALVLLLAGRVAARSVVRQMPGYVQTAIVVGAGHVGQLVVRKIQQHPEYGIKLVGFVDEDPRERRTDIADLPVLGGIGDLFELVSTHEIDRVIVAFSGEAEERTMSLVRSLRDEEVLVDVVPRLYRARRPARRRPPDRRAAAADCAPCAPVEYGASRQACDRHRRRAGPAADHLAVLPPGGVSDSPGVRRTGVLPPDSARGEHGALYCAQVSDR